MQLNNRAIYIFISSKLLGVDRLNETAKKFGRQHSIKNFLKMKKKISIH